MSLRLLLLSFCAASAAAQPVGLAASPFPPVPTDVVARDTFRSFGGRDGDVWSASFFTVEGDDELWVEVQDPSGARSVTPSQLFVYMGTLARAARQETNRIVTITASVPEIAVGAGLALVGLVGLVAVPGMGLRRRLRRSREREAALRRTARQLASGREEERKRLARDLHDGPLQDLHALHMQLGVAAAALDDALGADAVESRRLRGAQDEAHTIIGELRGIAEALRPPALGPFGLSAAIRAHTERFRRQHPGLAVDLALDDDGQALPEPVRIALFRVAQEAMTNAAKHAEPSRLAVTLRLDAEAVALVVEDDGVGYDGRADDPALVATGHFGLLGMRERADAVAGRLSVRDRVGGGTRVEIEVPR